MLFLSLFRGNYNYHWLTDGILLPVVRRSSDSQGRVSLKLMISCNYRKNQHFVSFCLKIHFTYNRPNSLQAENASFGKERILLKDKSLKRFNKVLLRCYKTYIG